jgi:hypothetical protein
LQRPEIFLVCEACLCTDADDFFTILRQQLFVWQAFLQEKKMRLAILQASFFCQCKKACQTKSFCFRMMKNCQHQHKGKPYTQEKSPDDSTSMEDAIADTVHPNGFKT